MTYKELKEFLETLTEEQLSQTVAVENFDQEIVDTVDGTHITEEDTYWDHGDCAGTLEQVKADNPDNWEEVIVDYTIVPAGTITLCAYMRETPIE